MSAPVISLASFRKPSAAPQPGDTSSPFKDFDEVCAYELPDPVWVDADLTACGYAANDERMFQAFFAWFGVDADLNKYPMGHSAAWAFLIGELGSAAGWHKDYPRTFRSQCGDWSQAQLDYLRAVMDGNEAKARELLGLTPLALRVRQELQTRSGPP